MGEDAFSLLEALDCSFDTAAAMEIVGPLDKQLPIMSMQEIEDVVDVPKEPLPSQSSQASPSSQPSQSSQAPHQQPQSQTPSAYPSCQIGRGIDSNNSSGSSNENTFFEIVSDNVRHFNDIGVVQQDVVLSLGIPPSAETQFDWVRSALESLIAFVMTRTGALPTDRVQLELTSLSRPERPLFITPRRGDQLSSECVFERLQKVLNSNEDFLLAGHLNVKFSVIKMPVGYGNNRIQHAVQKTMTFDQYCRIKNSVISITNDDNLCLARALVVAKAHHSRNEPGSMYKVIRQDRRALQGVMAQALCDGAEVDLTHGGGVPEIEKFQRFLTRYSITVWNDRFGRSTMFEGPVSTDTHPRINLDLIFENNHYAPLTSLPGAFGSTYFCRKCKVGYSNRTYHRCKTCCPACNGENECDQTTIRIECDRCNRSFYGADCYQRHFDLYSANRTLCQSVIKCKDCLKVYSNIQRKKNNPHLCGEIFCHSCKRFCKKNHLCFVQPVKLKNVKKNNKKKNNSNINVEEVEEEEEETEAGEGSSENSDTKTKTKRKHKSFLFVFFDLECMQSTPGVTPGEFMHEPNLCVARQCCDKCVDNYENIMDEYCVDCGVREKIFNGDECVDNFLEYLQNPVKRFEEIICIAHNGARYDFLCIIKTMIEAKGWVPTIINNGAKIMSLKYGNLHFIDSLNFLSASLAKLPKMMSIGGDLGKGYFPHLFNRPENQNYEGPIPSPKFYSPNDMGSKARGEFLEWHAEKVRQNYIFKFQTEILHYCKMDVEILMKACLKFRCIFLSETTVDPFKECITVASACMRTYLKLFLRQNTIPILPKNGYRAVDTQSLAALSWLDYQASARGIQIYHAGNGREIVPYRLNNKVDGFAPDQKVIFEFYGCYYHGCHLCFKEGRDILLHDSPDETMNFRYQKTMSREQDLLKPRDNNGRPLYELVSTWECQFNLLKQSDPAVRAFCENNKKDYLVPPLRPKDAFYGGRTNSVKLAYDADLARGEKIHYLDFTSLYPFCNKWLSYPVGHPRRIIHGADCETVNREDLSEYYGLIKCVVLPPGKLYHPVLPWRCQNKLFFPLCRICAENSIEENCSHTDQERALEGTWVTLEVQKALTLGYKILKVQEIWDYDSTQFDGQSGGLFVEYINTFLKMKQQASGWPDWCVTDEDRAKYIRDYKSKEDIELEPEKIEHNEGFRSCAKLLLNSFWGKWGQRDSFTNTHLVEGREEIHKILNDPSQEVHSFAPVTDTILMMTSKVVDEAVAPGQKSNVVLAAFVTAHARLKLYECLEKLGHRVLYYDTDSVIFTRLPHEPMLPTGDYLGELTDELSSYGKDSFIKSFIGGGPKNYAMQICVGGNPEDTKTVCKVRGFTLNHRASQKVNFDTIRNSVLNDIERAIVVPIPNKIVRKPGWVIVSRKETKKYSIVYTKRRRLPNSFDTVPFGTKRVRLE